MATKRTNYGLLKKAAITAAGMATAAGLIGCEKTAPPNPQGEGEFKIEINVHESAPSPEATDQTLNSCAKEKDQVKKRACVTKAVNDALKIGS